MTHSLRCFAVVLLLAAAACGRGRSPTCGGLAMLAGPAMIREQLRVSRAILTEAPRGLPETLPARAPGQAQQGTVTVDYSEGRLALNFTGPGFPQNANEVNGFGLLVVDDSTQRVQGVVLYESEVPRDFPQLGTVASAGKAIPLYGVRVDWASMSNPRCPLLGDTASTR